MSYVSMTVVNDEADPKETKVFIDLDGMGDSVGAWFSIEPGNIIEYEGRPHGVQVSRQNFKETGDIELIIRLKRLSDSELEQIFNRQKSMMMEQSAKHSGITLARSSGAING